MNFPNGTYDKFNIGINSLPSNNPILPANGSAAGTQMERPFELHTPNDDKKKSIEDKALGDDFVSKLRTSVDQATEVPSYAVRGLKGAPDFSFFEYLQVCQIPYYVGGPVLAALFNAGANNLNYQSKISAKKATKHMAVGVALYYLGAALAKSAIAGPVKLFRGIDLNQPYRDVIKSDADSVPGTINKTVEYHKVFESIDSTRWDLLYNRDDKTKPINDRYNKIAEKYGLEGDMNDSDSALKPYIKKTIVMSRAWQYALTAPFVALGIGLAKQEAWGNAFKNIGAAVKSIVSIKNKLPVIERLIRTQNLLNDNLVRPTINSFKQLWKGQGKVSGGLGKAFIIAPIVTTLLANLIILNKTSAKNERLINTKNR